MKLLFFAGVALLLVALPGQLQAEDVTASGTWSTGKSSGTWEATLNSEAEVVRGHLRLTGAPVPTADIAGTVRAGHIEFGVVSGQQEIATFAGTVTLGDLGGELTMGGVKGKWSGTWAPVPQPEAPIVNARSGKVTTPLSARSQMTMAPRPGNPCDLLTNGGARVLSGGGLSALQGMCARAGIAGGAPLSATTSISCDPGPPESNPPTPSTITGVLVNNVSRPAPNVTPTPGFPHETWPHITQSETTVIVSPLDQLTQVIAYNDSQTFNDSLTGYAGGIGFGYRSSSGGRSWTQNPAQLGLPRFSSGSYAIVPVTDPSGAVDSQGYFWIASVGYEVGTLLIQTGIAISKSSNVQGSAFDAAARAIQPAPYEAATRDKDWLAIDWTPNSPRPDAKYLCWTDVASDPSYTVIKFGRRLRDEDSFGPNPPYYTMVLDNVVPSDEGVVQGCQVAVAPDSSVYVIWWQGYEDSPGSGVFTSHIYGKRSTDGLNFPPDTSAFDASGEFTSPADATATADCYTYALAALNGHIRFLPLPSLAVNRQTGALYIAFTRQSAQGGSEIAFVRSNDQGASWSQPLVVNDSPAGDKFMPAVAHSVKQGAIKIMWYDRRNDPANISVDLYSATSTDGGASFGANLRLTAGVFGVPHLWPWNFDCVPGQLNPVPCYMGDYNSLANQDPSSVAFVHVWGDNSLKFHDPDDNLDVPDPDIRAYAGC